ncbi:hypothetical protein [Spiroplasma endosymbiont of Cleonymus obscurus]
MNKAAIPIIIATKALAFKINENKIAIEEIIKSKIIATPNKIR